ncbi:MULTISPECIES: GAF and ANTAR domain-containing protein [unclassified Curtobacterium]|uniref:GAF and ANTAR domain-containing protein n=1 Tax=unclassified Curtobacterium TaxID=257496 RepID=UPI003A8056F2
MDDYAAAASAMQAAPDGSDLCPPFLATLPVTTVGISTLGDPFGTATVFASDALAERVDEIQFDLGEGPCWEALDTRRPVLEPDLRVTPVERWPLALDGLMSAGVGAIFSFPMRIGTIPVGAVDLSIGHDLTLTAAQVRGAVELTEVAARRVLRSALVAATADEHTATENGRYSRREVHQATGMAAAQLGVSVEDALLVLRAHAFATERPVRDVAADVIARRLDLARPYGSET